MAGTFSPLCDKARKSARTDAKSPTPASYLGPAAPMFRRVILTGLAGVTLKENDEKFQAIQQSVAQANGLQVIDQKIPLPDLQIEYETREGETARRFAGSPRYSSNV